MNDFDFVFGRDLTNFHLEAEKLEGKAYKEYSTGSFRDPAPDFDTTDILPRKLVLAGDSLVIYFHVDSRYLFEPGRYRLKCQFRNNVRARCTTTSNWISFVVLRTIYVRHYYDEENDIDGH
jgi:hypothetical protein